MVVRAIRLITNGLFGWKGEGGGVEESRVVYVKNKLILYQIYSTLLYSTLPPSPSIQTDHKEFDF